MIITKQLPQPKTNLQEVLYTLIQNGIVSIFDFPQLSGFRTRVSELSVKYKVEIESLLISDKNKFGNHFQYALHSLAEENIDHAVKVYLKMCKDSCVLHK